MNSYFSAQASALQKASFRPMSVEKMEELAKITRLGELPCYNYGARVRAVVS